MAKQVSYVCDVKPCRLPAERVMEVKNQSVYFCSETCFLKYWSREYDLWKASRYQTIITLSETKVINFNQEAV
jgi:hypothetical protein